VVICLERGADLHMSQLMAVPLTVSCFSKIRIGFTFLVPAHPCSPEHRAVKRVCVCLSVCLSVYPSVCLSICLSEETGLEERLRNDLFCFEWDVIHDSVNQLMLQ